MRRAGRGEGTVLSRLRHTYRRGELRPGAVVVGPGSYAVTRQTVEYEELEPLPTSVSR